MKHDFNHREYFVNLIHKSTLERLALHSGYIFDFVLSELEYLTKRVKQLEEKDNERH